MFLAIKVWVSAITMVSSVDKLARCHTKTGMYLEVVFNQVACAEIGLSDEIEYWVWPGRSYTCLIWHVLGNSCSKCSVYSNICALLYTYKRRCRGYE